MLSTAMKFYEAMKEMIECGRADWKEFQRLVENDPDFNLSEAIAWLEDIEEGNVI
jgi:hypothetical protein